MTSVGGRAPCRRSRARWSTLILTRVRLPSRALHHLIVTRIPPRAGWWRRSSGNESPPGAALPTSALRRDVPRYATTSPHRRGDELAFVELLVGVAGAEQLVVLALADDPAAVHHHDR